MKQNLNDTEKLLRLCKKGNRRAQIQLYNQFSKAMYSSAYRILGNANDAEDALQEGFIAAFEKLDEVREAVKFPGWIKTIIVRKALTHLERKKNTLPLLPDLQVVPEYKTAEEGKTESRKKTLWQSIQQLKPNHRSVLVLMYYEGMDYEEISELMGLSKGNCRTLVSRAKEKLKKTINNTANVS